VHIISQKPVQEYKRECIEIAPILLNQAYHDPNKKNGLSAMMNELSARITGQKTKEKNKRKVRIKDISTVK